MISPSFAPEKIDTFAKTCYIQKPSQSSSPVKPTEHSWNNRGKTKHINKVALEEDMIETIFWIMIIPAVIISLSLYIIKPNERALLERLGNPVKTVESGLRFALWPISKFTRYTTEVVELPLSKVGILTKKEGELRQVKMNIDSVLYLYWPKDLIRVRKSLPSPDKKDDLINVLDEQTLEVVREVLSEKPWSTIWSKRKECGDDITRLLKSNTNYILGQNQADVEKFYVVIKHIEPPKGLEEAISAPEVARLEKQATIHRAEAEGEKRRLEGRGSADARSMLFDAIGNNPDRIRLELLLTLREMAQGTSNTILFPIPAEITTALSQMFGGHQGLDISQILNGLSPAQKQALINMLTQAGNQGGGNP